MTRIFIFLFTLLSFISCQVMQVARKISSTKVEVVTFQSATKTVQFIPMAHIGKQEFYDRVYSLVDTLKRSGYVAFHEGTTKKPLPPDLVSVIYDRIQRSPIAEYYQGSTNKDSIAEDLYNRKL